MSNYITIGTECFVEFIVGSAGEEGPVYDESNTQMSLIDPSKYEAFSEARSIFKFISGLYKIAYSFTPTEIGSYKVTLHHQIDTSDTYKKVSHINLKTVETSSEFDVRISDFI